MVQPYRSDHLQVEAQRFDCFTPRNIWDSSLGRIYCLSAGQHIGTLLVPTSSGQARLPGCPPLQLTERHPPSPPSRTPKHTTFSTLRGCLFCTRQEDAWCELSAAFSISSATQRNSTESQRQPRVPAGAMTRGSGGWVPSNAQATKPHLRYIFPFCPRLSPSGEKAFGCLPDSMLKIQIPGQNTPKN